LIDPLFLEKTWFGVLPGDSCGPLQEPLGRTEPKLASDGMDGERLKMRKIRESEQELKRRVSVQYHP
jgi:hypothetical protein